MHLVSGWWRGKEAKGHKTKRSSSGGHKLHNHQGRKAKMNGATTNNHSENNPSDDDRTSSSPNEQTRYPINAAASDALDGVPTFYLSLAYSSTKPIKSS